MAAAPGKGDKKRDGTKIQITVLPGGQPQEYLGFPLIISILRRNITLVWKNLTSWLQHIIE